VRADHYKAIHHVNLAHGAGVDALRAHNKDFSIGAIHNTQPSWPIGTTAEDTASAILLDEYLNKAFPDPQILGTYPPALTRLIGPYIQEGDFERIKRPVDWYGMNHYSPVYAKAAPDSELGFAWADAPADVVRSPIGWQIDPAAFRDTLLYAHHRYALPIYVTENGAGAVETPDSPERLVDSRRIEFLAAYTDAMREAMSAGADVRGYFVWCLLDNFEWGAGYASRFGLVYVDHATQQRILKASAHWYGGLIKADVEAG
jgi:beta-glucosidase